MTTLKPSFLVPGIGYLVLGFVTLGYGLLKALPEARHAQVSSVAVPALVLIVVLVTAFYFALGLSILKRKGRRFAIIGAGFSCLLIPFGTALGLTFLLWTRREWTRVSVKAHEAEVGAALKGGPAEPPGTSGVCGGPPSVS